MIPLNPCSNIKKAFEAKPRGEFAYIPFEELPEFCERLQNSNLELLTRYLIQWQLLTMIRANEAVTAEYTDIDEEKRLWVIPPQKMKQKHGGKPHIVPLSKQAYSLLQKIKTLANGNGYLFPSVRTKTGRMNPQTVNKAIRKSLGYSKEALTAHGLRKTTSSYLHEKGILPDVVELCLSHTIGGLRGVYNKAKYLPQRREAMQLWGDYVAQCMAKSGVSHLKLVAW
ncbi:tyrosine-type recombinase/integrase [Mannheimia haemolytica]